MIDYKDDGDDGGGSGCGFVALIFDGSDGGLVDFLLGFSCDKGLSDRTTTLHLSLFAIGLKWGFKKWICLKLRYEKGIYKVTMEKGSWDGFQRVFSFSGKCLLEKRHATLKKREV